MAMVDTQVDVRDKVKAQLGTVFIPGGTFRMGSNKHYPEEAPAHRVTVDSFYIDAKPVTNRDFRKFANTTGYVTFAEIKPKTED
jgi:formylglycine-generating enzyme